MTGSTRFSRSSVAAIAVAGLFLVLSGCKRFQRKHIPVERVQELGYPTCNGVVPGPGELVAETHIRSGPNHQDKNIVEHFWLRRRGCMWSAVVRQDWPMATADVEVLYDAQFKPLRIWKRLVLPSLPRPQDKADTRRYELRTQPVEIKRKHQEGNTDFEQLLGGKPMAVIGPGRGIIAMWIRKAKLREGEKVREPIIDVRGLETIEPVTLLREPDQDHAELGRVQVYTFYGRETVFVNQQGMVVGDLAGLRPYDQVQLPAPPPVPLFGPVDPVNTP